MYQAIIVKFFGPTNARGSHVKATIHHPDGKKTFKVGFHSHEKPFEHAAHQLALKLALTGAWRGGSLDAGDTMVFVRSHEHSREADFNVFESDIAMARGLGLVK